MVTENNIKEIMDEIYENHTSTNLRSLTNPKHKKNEESRVRHIMEHN